MFKIRIVLLILWSVMQSACAVADDGAQTGFDFNGRWQNENRSELVFSVKDNMVQGRYNTNLGEPDKSKSFPLVGQVDGDQIVFTVNFKGFHSLTAWVGQVALDKDGKPYLRTLWHNTKNVEDALESDEIWSSIRTGASEFRRVLN